MGALVSQAQDMHLFDTSIGQQAWEKIHRKLTCTTVGPVNPNKTVYPQLILWHNLWGFKAYNKTEII